MLLPLRARPAIGHISDRAALLHRLELQRAARTRWRWFRHPFGDSAFCVEAPLLLCCPAACLPLLLLLLLSLLLPLLCNLTIKSPSCARLTCLGHAATARAIHDDQHVQAAAHTRALVGS